MADTQTGKTLNQCRLTPFGRHWFLLSYSCRQIVVPYYSGLTKTSTALPRLAVLLYCLRLRRLVLIFVNPLYITCHNSSIFVKTSL
ncbi:hypothetical protein GHI53_05135 [Neisseria meningitidis]|nr:hypothetical protein [Neisseria meningitidis]